ncbi:hypothetical protein BC629DRAFT_1595968 [Irpex lacteus]|nr:hypothetical protein BC629DRAFT_1595968 [Irpex lacteus]
MPRALPEEILLEILKIYFHTQTSLLDFLTESRETWQYKYKDTYPTHLSLVSKQWTRIITPLLYENVSIESDADLDLFARTITSNRALGSLVRRLRLNGGYGRKLGEVAKYLPAMRVLVLGLYVLSKTPVSGLMKVLPLFDPTEVYLHDMTRHCENQASRKITEAVIAQLPNWKAMKLLSFPSTDFSLEIEKWVSRALQGLASLPGIAFDCTHLKQLLADPVVAQAIRRLGVQTIRCYGTPGCLNKQVGYVITLGTVPEDLKRMVVYEETKHWRLEREQMER